MPAPDEIKKLVDRFTLHRDEYLGGNYNETELRREFRAGFKTFPQQLSVGKAFA